MLKKEVLGPGIKRFELDARDIARKALPGQFVVLRIREEGERIPLTIADTRPDDGVIAIVFQEVGKSTKLLGTLEKGDSILDVIGPLGNPSEIEKFGTVVCVAGGVGTPEILPLARALTQAGNKVITILGFRNKDLILMEPEMKAVSSELIVTTDDGSNGTKGFVTDALKQVIERGTKVDRVIAVGPVIMMKMVSKLTEPHAIPTIVSLNPIMLDGTGMCGACRVNVGGETKLACVDGPEFDGHKVDFDLLMQRLKIYLPQEKESLELFKKTCEHQGENDA
ncbi:ferredoxin-NADP reductase [candidate division WOR-3 bacterium JGI_Cruoil_03_51_56]|uniref:Ferredoxin-NADP reductase n=1 Tax=candidate division WOR-3 bacterium JGI_Cruoil_03_51_56 TaxID=1973747 RepID=A0A235BTZ3_UNCW3|nr:MAG: ferredoxin-NADP reductase [candidate division WOR-3 bacterium JGI_Cruoil_03_51_56]